MGEADTGWRLQEDYVGYLVKHINTNAGTCSYKPITIFCTPVAEAGLVLVECISLLTNMMFLK